MPQTTAKLLTKSWPDDFAISANSEYATFPVDNLLEDELEDVYRSLDTSVIVISGQFDEAKPIDSFGFINHNMQAKGTIRLELSNVESFNTVTLDQTYAPYDPAYGWGEWLYDLSEWGGYDSSTFEPKSCVQTFDLITATYWRITLTDLDNPAGYLEASRLMLGSSFHTAINIAYGAQLYTIDPTTFIEAESGITLSNEGTPHREQVLTWRFATEAEARLFNEATRVIGRRKAMLVIPYPDKSSRARRQHIMYCKLKLWRKPTLQHSQHYFLSATLIELVE